MDKSTSSDKLNIPETKNNNRNKKRNRRGKQTVKTLKNALKTTTANTENKFTEKVKNAETKAAAYKEFADNTFKVLAETKQNNPGLNIQVERINFSKAREIVNATDADKNNNNNKPQKKNRRQKKKATKVQVSENPANMKYYRKGAAPIHHHPIQLPPFKPKSKVNAAVDANATETIIEKPVIETPEIPPPENATAPTAKDMEKAKKKAEKKAAKEKLVQKKNAKSYNKSLKKLFLEALPEDNVYAGLQIVKKKKDLEKEGKFVGSECEKEWAKWCRNYYANEKIRVERNSRSYFLINPDKDFEIIKKDKYRPDEVYKR